MRRPRREADIGLRHLDGRAAGPYMYELHEHEDACPTACSAERGERPVQGDARLGIDTLGELSLQPVERRGACGLALGAELRDHRADGSTIRRVAHPAHEPVGLEPI